MKEKFEDFVDMIRENEKARLIFVGVCAFVIGVMVGYL